MLNGLTAIEFMKRRIVRLFPTFWLGCVISSISIILNLRHGNGSIFLSILKIFMNSMLIPFPPGDGNIYTFPLIVPAWSLFFELWIANIIYAFFWRYFTSKILYIIIAISLASLMVAMYYNGSADMGATWPTFWGGFPRVFFSFFAGVLLQRNHRRLKIPAIPGYVILIIAATSFWVRVPAPWEVAYTLASIAIIYPALIYFGSNSIERRPHIGATLGNISYAVYVIHLPLLALLLRYNDRMNIPLDTKFATIFVFFVMFAAYIIDKYYDKKARSILVRFLV